MDVRNMYIKLNDKVIDKPSSNQSALPQLHIASPKQELQNEASVHVSLSKEGKEKSEQLETKDHFKSLREKEPEQADAEQGTGDQVDEKLKELKEKIAELQQQLAQHKNKQGDEERVKQLESEIAILQAQMMSLLNEKLQGKSAS